MLRLDRLQKLFAYLTVAFALGAMAGAGALQGVVLFAVPAAVLVSWFWDPDRFDLGKQRIVWNLVLVGFILWTAWIVSQGTMPVLRPAVDLVLVLAVAKLFQRQNARDYAQIYALAFLMVAVATVLDDGLGFAGFFVGFLVSAGIGFSLCHLLHLVETEKAEPIVITRRTAAMLGGMGVLLVVLAAGFFLFLPRVGIGMGAGGPQTNATRMTGFSDTIELGDHGAIGLDETVVMRVAMDGPVEAPYWRGMSFDYFDGQSWTSAPPLRRRQSVPLEGESFVIPDRRQEDLVKQNVELEPINADLLIGLTMPSQISYETDGRASDTWRNVSIDRSGALHHSYGSHQRVEYTVKSSVLSRSDVAETRDPAPPHVRRFYLSIPHGISSRTRQLAIDVADGKTTTMARATAIESYLKTEYSYTLELPERGNNPVDNFLFEDKRGHCEFFSTSMVLLLRQLGIPARNVNGFQGGEWNEVGGYYVVRRLHAHSWVEAWIPGTGWVTFDPTPASGIPQGRNDNNEGFFGQFGEYLDALRRTWRQWVLNYDFQQQLNLFGDNDASSLGESISGAAKALLENWLGWLLLLALFTTQGVLLSRIRRPGFLTVSVIGACQVVVFFAFVSFSMMAFIASVAVPLWLLWQLRIAADQVGTGVASTPLGRLRDSIQSLASSHPDFSGSHADGPLHLADHLERLGGAWRAAAGIIRDYGRLRFGKSRPSPAEIAGLNKRWRAIKGQLKAENRSAVRRVRSRESKANS